MIKKYLSIIINCHNDEQYILQCIESIITQVINGIEIICVDDASEDNSIKIINHYASQVKIKRFNKNVGLSYARNAALKIANGNYIMFVDGDDYISNGALERILTFINFNSCDVLMGLMEVFKDSPDVLDRWNDPVIKDLSVFENKSVGEIFTLMCDLKLKIAPVQKYIIKKSFIETNSLWFEDVLHEDQLWTPKMLCCAKNVGFMNYKFYYHRIRKNSLGDRFDENVCKSYFQTCKKLLSFASELSDSNKINFLKSRCEYLLVKINNRISEWDLQRLETFLSNNKTNISELTSSLDLHLNILEGIK